MFSSFAIAQESHPNKLPPCPRDQTVRYHNCFGTYTFANGDKYIGEFMDNMYNGSGILTTANGERKECIWENDKFIREAKVNLPIQNDVIATASTELMDGCDVRGNITHRSITVEPGALVFGQYIAMTVE
jgi:hypothetical protein